VPVYRNAALVKDCVDSLLAHRWELGARRSRVILIDDSPGDDEVAELLATYESGIDDLIVLRNEVNLGFVRTVNRGLRLALDVAHDVLLVNSDTLTFPDTLSQLVQAAEADAQIGFASPRSNNAALCSLPHQQVRPDIEPALAHRRWQTLARSLPALHFVPTAIGFYLFIKYRVLADVGVLREDFGVGYEEENELVMRAGKFGYRAVLANYAFAFHAGAASFNLTGLDLAAHRRHNLDKLIGLHPEFTPLLRQYERSSHFRAEQLLAGMLPDGEGRISLVFDLTSARSRGDGTHGIAAKVLTALLSRHGHRLRVTAICSDRAFALQGLDAIPGLQREEPGAGGLHAIVVRLVPPDEVEDLVRMDALAPVQIFFVHDTRDEDRGPLAASGMPAQLWDHVARHAHGLVFVSECLRQAFCVRHPEAQGLPNLARLLPTRLGLYGRPAKLLAAGYVLLVCDKLAGGSDITVSLLATRHPGLQFLALGTPGQGPAKPANLQSFDANALSAGRTEALIARAAVVVLLSHGIGFDCWLMQVLAAQRPVVVRRTPAVLEMLWTLDGVEGVCLFASDAELDHALSGALSFKLSAASDKRTGDWNTWADAFAEFCIAQTADPRLFERLATRLAVTKLLTCAAATPASRQTHPSQMDVENRAGQATVTEAACVDLETLLAMDGRSFVAHAYATLLCRPADKAGVEFYTAQLSDGVPKIEMLRALSISPEGRARNVQIDGMQQRFAAQASAPRRLLRKLLGR